MIVFDLKCGHGHSFEGWFRGRDDFSRQRDAGILSCPECASVDISKAFSAPKLAGLRGSGGDDQDRTGGTLSAASSSGEKDGKGAGHAPPMPHDARAAPGQMPPTAMPPKTMPDSLHKALIEMRRQVEQNCDYVGDRFAEEARRMHYGETEKRDIYGEASLKDAADLIDEGVDVMPLPGGRRPSDA
ncbi:MULTISPECIES: DUF1178 family protein [unclassified Iodidimonas]|jgi:hypothetical protein|uniref:DUF1178 family protein n=1 Tax=unclassified Iodidimonas TaxID=2626145 RepID=UPI002482E65E|nr:MULTISPECIES: DUF1178 family protein [unclassified Iodidimonas]